MENLLPIINFYRQQPQGYYVVGQNYGYNDTYETAVSLDGQKILEIWMVNSGFNRLMDDFNGWLTSKLMEHDNDDNPMELFDEKKHADMEYETKLEIYAKERIPEFDGQSMIDVDEDSRTGLTNYVILFNNKMSVADNQILAYRIYEYAFQDIKRLSWATIDTTEFYFRGFDDSEELNNILANAKDEN